jgi:DNA-binding transcriptional LysR family regulator
METDSSQAIEQRLVNSTIDVALINSPSYFANCTYEVFRDQETLAFMAGDNPFTQTAMSLKTLTRESLVVRKGSACVKELIRRGYGPNIVLEFIAPDAVKVAVQQELGVGLLFRSRIKADIEKGDVRVIEVSELRELTHKSLIIYRKQNSPSPMTQEFIQILRGMRTPSAGSAAAQNAIAEPVSARALS